MKTPIEKFIEKNSAYFEEIRKKLFRLALLFVFVLICAFLYAVPIIKLFLRVFHAEYAQVIVTSPFQFFSLAMNEALFLATVVVFPVLVFQIYFFLRPALTKKERRRGRNLILMSFFLFCSGFVFGLGVMYYVIGIMARATLGLGVANMWDISFFVSQILLTAALMGVLFQYPLVLSALIRMGIIEVDSLRRRRRLAIGSSFVVSSLLPPTDALSLIVMALPLIILYEMTIFLNRKFVQGIQVPPGF